VDIFVEDLDIIKQQPTKMQSVSGGKVRGFLYFSLDCSDNDGNNET
jgi:hypothetical protein